MRPELGAFTYYVEAFGELSTARPAGMGTSPIPFTAIVEYFKIFIDPDGANYQNEDFVEFFYLMRLMDDTLLRLESKKKVREKTPEVKNGPGKTAPANNNSSRRG